MLRVKVGKDNIPGTVDVSYRVYEWEMAKFAGNHYAEVHTEYGILFFRYRYLREVEENDDHPAS